MKPRAISASDARWMAIEAQGLAAPRPARPGPARILSTVRRLAVLQLDAINVVERTQHLVLFSRLGAHRRDALHDLTGPRGALLETTAHEASLVPMEHQPLLRWRHARHGTAGGKWGEYMRAYERAQRDYIAAVLAEVRERGPLTASQLSDPRRRQGEWWGRRSHGRQALEWLFAKGQLAGWRTRAFERVYDVPERVLAPEVMAIPTPPEPEAQRALVEQAAAALGVATLADLSDYFRMSQAETKLGIADLVGTGALEEVRVEGWKELAYCPTGARPRPPRRDHATLLSPFDSLIWDRRRTLRLFDFDYRIEVYVPQPKRRFGYYVLPLLLGDQIVGRFDLKADRPASRLLVQASYVEEGADPRATAAAAGQELVAMASWLGLSGIEVARRGSLAAPLRAAL